MAEDCLRITVEPATRQCDRRSCHYCATDEASRIGTRRAVSRVIAARKADLRLEFVQREDASHTQLSSLRRGDRTARHDGLLVHHVVSGLRAAVAARTLESRAFN